MPIQISVIEFKKIKSVRCLLKTSITKIPLKNQQYMNEMCQNKLTSVNDIFYLIRYRL